MVFDLIIMTSVRLTTPWARAARMTGVWTFLSDPANWSGSDGIWNRVFEHLGYTFLALAVAMLIALPLGALIGHTGRGAGLIGGVRQCAAGAAVARPVDPAGALGARPPAR